MSLETTFRIAKFWLSALFDFQKSAGKYFIKAYGNWSPGNLWLKTLAPLNLVSNIVFFDPIITLRDPLEF